MYELYIADVLNLIFLTVLIQGESLAVTSLGGFDCCSFPHCHAGYAKTVGEYIFTVILRSLGLKGRFVCKEFPKTLVYYILFL